MQFICNCLYHINGDCVTALLIALGVAHLLYLTIIVAVLGMVIGEAL